MPQRAITTPLFDFMPNASTWADKVVMRLEDMMPFCIPGFDPMPDTVEIVECWPALQSAYDLTGIFGNIWTSLATPDYVDLADVPGRELCTPFGLIPLGPMPIRAGIDQFRQYIHPESILYRKGIDRIFFGREVSGANGKTISPGVTFSVKAVSNAQWPSDGKTVFFMPSDREAAAGTYCARTLIPSVKIGGSQVSVRVTAGAAGCALSHMSAGIQASGSTMTATPVPLLFSGAAGVTLAAHGVAWATGSLAVAAGQSLLINAETAGPYPYRDVLPAGVLSWYSTAANYNSAAMAGAAAAAHGYVIDCVRVM